MVLLASVSTSLLIALAAVLVVMLGIAAVYAQAQSRRRTSAKSDREAKEARQRDDELAHIRQRIEEIYERQQTGSETQFARVNQELEQLQMNLDAKGRQMEGVQGQLRYQLRQHEDEIGELRNQLREAVEVFAAAALPAARPSAPALQAHTPPSAEPKPPAAPAVRPTPIQAPVSVNRGPAPASRGTEEAPAFAPLGEMLKDDQELLDDLFSGTDLDSQDEPADTTPTPPTIAPIDLTAGTQSAEATPPVAETQKTAQPVQAEPEDAAEPVETEADPSFPAIPEALIAEQVTVQDDFEFVEIDPPAMTGTPLPESTDEPAPSAWPEAAEEEEIIDLTPVAAWPETSALPEIAVPDEVEPVPAHSGDGMSTGTYDDPFAETEASFDPQPATDLDSADLAPVATAPKPPAAAPVAPVADRTAAVAEPDAASLASELVPVADEAEDEAEHEHLTTITAVDEETQSKLYALGVTDIETIARWTRADARRMATQLAGVTEEDIMDRWIFEAQSILFERYQDELRAQREQHLSA